MGLKRKMFADAAALAEARKAHEREADGFLNGKRPTNLVGMGLGVKWQDGKPTGEPALIALVTRKLVKSDLFKHDVIPAKIGGMQTDVLAVGEVSVWPGRPPKAQAGAKRLIQRVRPAMGGMSVGHHKITAGTIGTCGYDILPGGTATPPKHGLGMPQKFYIVSNNHVLANVNAAKIGDIILQPGPYDGGKLGKDNLGELARFEWIALTPEIPAEEQQNEVDFGAGEVEFDVIDREIIWIGRPRGWRRTKDVAVGLGLEKTGRTTMFSTGHMTVVGATIDVGYGEGRLGRFKNQFLTTPMSAGGDSGSLVLTHDKVAVGLLFAGSDRVTILNPIESVRTIGRIEIADQIL